MRGSGGFILSSSRLIRGNPASRCQAENPLIPLYGFVRPVLAPVADIARSEG